MLYRGSTVIAFQFGIIFISLYVPYNGFDAYRAQFALTPHGQRKGCMS